MLFINRVSVVVLTFKQCFEIDQVCFIHGLNVGKMREET